MSESIKPVFWEDFEVGVTVPFGRKHVTREEIISFAREFDPQPFHLDEARARDTLLGGLAASGWHSCAMLMRMICDDYLLGSAGMGGAGVEEVRWLKPVRPDDTIRVEAEVKQKRESKSRADRGLLMMGYTVKNQKNEPVMTFTAMHILQKRAA